MTNVFAELAQDPRLIAGVYHYCDEWCEFCPVAGRCLANRCSQAYRRGQRRGEGEPTFRSAAEAVSFTRAVSAAEAAAGREGTPWGDVTDRTVSPLGFRASDPLASAALQYGLAVGMWLVLTPDELRRMRVGDAPSPEEVLLWYHLRVYTTVLRLLAAADRGRGRKTDATRVNGLAKAVLVAVGRSRRALLQMRRAAADTVSPLVAMLDALERGLESRFPDARTHMRPGLDGPAD